MFEVFEIKHLPDAVGEVLFSGSKEECEGFITDLRLGANALRAPGFYDMDPYRIVPKMSDEEKWIWYNDQYVTMRMEEGDENFDPDRFDEDGIRNVE